MSFLWFECAMRSLERAVPIAAVVGITTATLYCHAGR